MRASSVALLLLVALAPPRVFADCQKGSRGDVVCGRGQCVIDLAGRVFCARNRYGAVVRTVDGSTLCGKGQCASTLKGQWLCSTVEDGSVFKDWDGTIKCDGGCEPASVANCQTEPAGG